jgi:hypothetical protein
MELMSQPHGQQGLAQLTRNGIAWHAKVNALAHMICMGGGYATTSTEQRCAVDNRRDTFSAAGQLWLQLRASRCLQMRADCSIQIPRVVLCTVAAVTGEACTEAGCLRTALNV